MTDALYAVLRCGEMQKNNGTGLSKRECSYMLYLYKKLGLNINMSFTLASNGLRSGQVCNLLDDCLRDGYFEMDKNGHYLITEEGLQTLQCMVYTVEEWKVLRSFELWLERSTLEEKHFQAVVYLLLVDSDRTPDNLWNEKENIKGIVKNLVSAYSDGAFYHCVDNVMKFNNKFSELQ